MIPGFQRSCQSQLRSLELRPLIVVEAIDMRRSAKGIVAKRLLLENGIDRKYRRWSRKVWAHAPPLHASTTEKQIALPLTHCLPSTSMVPYQKPSDSLRIPDRIPTLPSKKDCLLKSLKDYMNYHKCMSTRKLHRRMNFVLFPTCEVAGVDSRVTGGACRRTAWQLKLLSTDLWFQFHPFQSFGRAWDFHKNSRFTGSAWNAATCEGTTCDAPCDCESSSASTRRAKRERLGSLRGSRGRETVLSPPRGRPKRVAFWRWESHSMVWSFFEA